MKTSVIMNTSMLCSKTERNELDRLVLQNPNSSMAWLRYVSFELERNAIEKARLVAERALKTISFR